MKGHRSVVVALASFAGVSACSTPRAPIEIEESDELLPFVRASIALGEEEDSGRELAWIDLEVAGVSGNDTQSLEAGESLQLDDVSFTGPAAIDFDYRLTTASLALRGGFREGDFSFQAFAGIGWTAVDLRAASGGVTDDEAISSLGLLLGLRVAYSPIEKLEIYTRGSIMPSFADDVDGTDFSSVEFGAGNTNLSSLEVGAQYRLVDAVSVTGGWRYMNYEIDAFDDIARSDIDLEVSGLMLGIGFHF